MRKEKKGPASKPYQPPYSITPAMLRLVEKIGEHLGVIKTTLPDAQKPHLHRINRIKTIQGTLEIEGNTLRQCRCAWEWEGSPCGPSR